MKEEVLVKYNVHEASWHKCVGTGEPLEWKIQTSKSGEPKGTTRFCSKKSGSSAQYLQMIREAKLRVNRAVEALRQEDCYNEMNAIVSKMTKLVKEGTKVQQAESDRPIKKVNWAMKEDNMQIRYELDAAIIESTNKMQEIEKEKGRQGVMSFRKK